MLIMSSFNSRAIQELSKRKFQMDIPKLKSRHLISIPSTASPNRKCLVRDIHQIIVSIGVLFCGLTAKNNLNYIRNPVDSIVSVISHLGPNDFELQFGNYVLQFGETGPPSIDLD